MQIAIDTLFVNAADVERAVAGIKAHLGLAPFLSFELIVRNGSPVPIVIFVLEGGSLEILGRAVGSRPASGVISCVEMEAPIAERVELELAPNAALICHPGGPSRASESSTWRRTTARKRPGCSVPGRRTAGCGLETWSCV